MALRMRDARRAGTRELGGRLVRRSPTPSRMNGRMGLDRTEGAVARAGHEGARGVGPDGGPGVTVAEADRSAPGFPRRDERSPSVGGRRRTSAAGRTGAW